MHSDTTRHRQLVRPATPAPHAHDLLGRDRERAVLAAHVQALRSGDGSVLRLQGPHGAGRSALLDDLARGSEDVVVVRLAGVASETSVPWAGVQRLLQGRPRNGVPLPRQEADAIAVVTREPTGDPLSRALVGAALQRVLGRTGSRVLHLVDDAHLLDDHTLDVLSYISRRGALGSAAVVVTCPDHHGRRALDEIPGLTVPPLDPRAGRELLRRATRLPLDPVVADRVVAALGHNPLAVVEAGTELRRLGGGSAELLGAPPIGPRTRANHLARARQLPPEARLWLLVAAAAGTGDASVVDRAAAAIGLPPDASAPAEDAGLVRVRTSVVFREPLVAAALYDDAPRAARRQAHAAVGASLGAHAAEVVRAHHLAAAAPHLDEAIASRLAALAWPAAADLGPLTAPALLLRAAELSPDPADRAARLLGAARSAVASGAPALARELLSRLDDDAPASGSAAVERLLVEVDTDLASTTAATAQAPARLLGAAQVPAQVPAHVPPHLRSAVLLRALDLVAELQGRATAVRPEAVADRATRRQRGRDHLGELVLDAVTAITTTPLAPATVDLTRSAVEAVTQADDTDLIAHAGRGVVLATAVWDSAAREALLLRAHRVARRCGALSTAHDLQWRRALAQWELGNTRAATGLHRELGTVSDLLPLPVERRTFLDLLAAGWSAPPQDAAAVLTAARDAARAAGTGLGEVFAERALAGAELAAARYDEALAASRRARALAAPVVGAHLAADHVESAIRTGHRTEATEALAVLASTATAVATAWVRGVHARCAALVAAEADAEPLFRTALTELGGTPAVGDLGRTHLLYGEWLRRRRRRREAREHLSRALSLLDQVGHPAAHRAAVELQAGTDGGTDRYATALTVQEAAVAALAASGATNAEIARRLFLSRHTVDYHLRKVFRKLQVSDRRQLPARLEPHLAGG